jgi:hypothetical protein
MKEAAAAIANVLEGITHDHSRYDADMEGTLQVEWASLDHPLEQGQARHRAEEEARLRTRGIHLTAVERTMRNREAIHASALLEKSARFTPCD